MGPLCRTKFYREYPVGVPLWVRECRLWQTCSRALTSRHTRTQGPFKEMRPQRFSALWVHVFSLKHGLTPPTPPHSRDWIWSLFRVIENRTTATLGKDMNKWSPWWRSSTSHAEDFATIIKGSFHEVNQCSVFVVPQYIRSSTWHYWINWHV